MNTEIKFRGWSIEGKKWLYGGVLFFKDGTAIMPDGEENEKMITSPVDPKSIGRFTGFCDRDDVEIYEGVATPLMFPVVPVGARMYLLAAAKSIS